jgi:hypothetical protein
VSWLQLGALYAISWLGLALALGLVVYGVLAMFWVNRARRR